jgi:cyclic-di-GMP-binding protein
MSLVFSVPPVDVNLFTSAETNPNKIQELIATLPKGNPGQAAKIIIEQLHSLNRQQVSSESRIMATELYRPTIAEIVIGLARQYCYQPLPLSDSALRSARAARTLYSELAYSYKHTVLAEENKLFGFGGEKQRAQHIQRAIEALGNLLLVVYHTYSTAPSGVWAEIHNLFLYGLQQSLQEIEVDIGHKISSINLTYKRTLLLALADIHHLTSNEINWVVDYIDRFAHHAQLRPFSKPEKLVGAHLVHLASDKPPEPFNKRNESINMNTDIPVTDIMLITIKLAQLVYHQLGMLQVNEPPVNLKLPESAQDPHYQDLLAHLLKQWGKPPKRLFNRIKKLDVVNMCLGLSTVHYYVNRCFTVATPSAETEKTKINLSFADSPIDTNGGSTFHYARWMVVNESAGGMAMSKMADAQVALRVGELVGIRIDDSSDWNVASLRWALCSDYAPLGIGVQLLSPTAQAVMVTLPELSHSAIALLLPEVATLSQQATLITPPGIFKPARKFLLDEQGKTSEILATRLVERTASFERFQFSRL